MKKNLLVLLTCAMLSACSTTTDPIPKVPAKLNDLGEYSSPQNSHEDAKALPTVPDYETLAVSMMREVELEQDINLIQIVWDHPESEADVMLVSPEGDIIEAEHPDIHFFKGKIQYYTSDPADTLTPGTWTVKVSGVNLGPIQISTGVMLSEGE